MTFDIDAHRSAIAELPLPPAPPKVDDQARAVLDEAETSPTAMRFPLAFGDAAAEPHVLASLLTDLTARIPHAVSTARDQDYSRDGIAECLATSTSSARRWCHRADRRHQPR